MDIFATYGFCSGYSMPIVSQNKTRSGWTEHSWNEKQRKEKILSSYFSSFGSCSLLLAVFCFRYIFILFQQLSIYTFVWRNVYFVCLDSRHYLNFKLILPFSVGDKSIQFITKKSRFAGVCLDCHFFYYFCYCNKTKATELWLSLLHFNLSVYLGKWILRPENIDAFVTWALNYDSIKTH